MATHLRFPPADSVVRIRAINAETYMSLYAQRFMEPEVQGYEIVNFTSICFLIEHPKLHQKVLFDCGARKDFENYSSVTKAKLGAILKGIRVEADVNDILLDANFDLNSINSMIWSHWHWDHHGAPEKFPSSVEVVVGPGFSNEFMPGYPTSPHAALLDANFDGRTVREIDFENSSLQIGQLRAYDFFADGSFYLLDTPGHAIGHMCGLARTTPTTFVFLGGDICHFYGMVRPSPGVPLPDPIPSDHLDDGFPSPCPCSLFTDHHPRVEPQSAEAKATPFFEVTSAIPSSYHDYKVARNIVKAMQDFDASPDVLVCIAHDPTLLKVLPVLNDQPDEDLNDWKARGYKEKLLWGWLNDLPREGKPGRPTLVDGIWRDGKRVPDVEQLPPSL
ncbi:hypothetical protein LTR37_012883 [Vermiconidia calcicola]|uniref:Uncharacterized protein n=1 Tax=Vermiconidia calcicola TaxID=1690605 RepID=A0ACC3MZD8_9PEZI|nr:hypothetical protein LTR37_012883 [Vermiconidia calcicola]